MTSSILFTARAYSLLIALLVGHLFKARLAHLINYSDCMSPYCVCINLNTLHCTNFTSFRQLDFRTTHGRVFEAVELVPSKVLLDVNEDLNFEGLHLDGKLMLTNVRSFKAFYNPFLSIKTKRFSLAIIDSYFKFVNSTSSAFETELINECVYGDKSLGYLNFVFGDLNLFEFAMCNVYFEQELCPIMFKNTAIKTMVVTDVTGAFGFKQLKTSNSIFEPIDSLLNVNISLIDFSFGEGHYIETLVHPQPLWLDSEHILNADMFKSLTRVNINKANNLVYIQEKTFLNLPNVKRLEMNDVNFKNLITRSRRFIKYLNSRQPTYDIDKNLISAEMASNVFLLIIWVRNNLAFDDHDICLFKNFPHQKLVFPFLLFTNESFPCTCTVYWLYKYFPKYQLIFNLNQDFVPYHCFNSVSWGKCDFPVLFNDYCGGMNFPDPEEPFTTLLPSMRTTTYTISTQLMTTNLQTMPTFPMAVPTAQASTSSSPQPKAIQSSLPQQFINSLKLAESSNNNSLSPNESNLVVFYIAIALSIICAVIVAALVILYYRVFYEERLDRLSRKAKQVDFDVSISDKLEYI